MDSSFGLGEIIFLILLSLCGGPYLPLTMTGMHKEPQFSWESSEKELHELGHRSEASSSGNRLSSWGSEGLPVTSTPRVNTVLCPRSGQSPVIAAVSRGKCTLPAFPCSHTCPGCQGHCGCMDSEMSVGEALTGFIISKSQGCNEKGWLQKWYSVTHCTLTHIAWAYMHLWYIHV